MTHPLERLQAATRAGCPFCLEWIPNPKPLKLVGSESVGGICPCGAAFAIDETGRLGGQTLIDAQTLLCDGDISAAMKLETGVHIDVETRPWHARTATAMGARSGGQVGPKVWFVKRRAG